MVKATTAKAALRLPDRRSFYRSRALVSLALTCCAFLLVLSCASRLPQEALPSPATDLTVTDEGLFTEAEVVQVIDGSTIDVRFGGTTSRVRYLGIQVPETASREAYEYNTFLVQGQTVRLEKGIAEADPAGRLLRYVYVGGEMVNMSLLTNGYAVVTDFPAGFRHQTSFMVAQQNAKSDRRGLWKSSGESEDSSEQTKAPETEFAGGTLPRPPTPENDSPCDFSGTSEPIIKGNVDPRTGEHVYHVPGGFFYSTTVVDEPSGDRWLCTEDEARAAGWKKSKH